MRIFEMADTYKQKLLESGYENVDVQVVNEDIIISFTSEAADMQTRVYAGLLFSPKGSTFKKEGNKHIFTVAYTHHLHRPITDLDRLTNKVNKVNNVSNYDTHANRFIVTLKHFYDIDMTLDEYDDLCRNGTGAVRMKPIYNINNSVRVASIRLKKKLVYVIYGSKSERVFATFKTCLPNVYDKKTLLPVPDKILMSGINKIEFNKMLHEIVVEKKAEYQKLFEKIQNKTNKELFLSDEYTREEKIHVAKLRLGKEYTLEDGIKDLTKKHSRRI